MGTGNDDGTSVESRIKTILYGFFDQSFVRTKAQFLAEGITYHLEWLKNEKDITIRRPDSSHAVA